MTSRTRLRISAGSASVTVNIFIADQTTEHGKTGLAYDAPNLVCYAAVAGQAAQQVTLAAQSPGGAYSSGGFCAISSANMPGVYRFDIPNSLLSANKQVTVLFYGADGMSPALLEIDCSKTDADMKWIDGQATSGNNATLRLKQLNIQNSSGTALYCASTGSDGKGAEFIGNGSGAGAYFYGGAAAGDGATFKGNGTGNGAHMEGGPSFPGAGLSTKSTASWGSGTRFYTNGYQGFAWLAEAYGNPSHGFCCTASNGNGVQIWSNSTDANNAGVLLAGGASGSAAVKMSSNASQGTVVMTNSGGPGFKASSTGGNGAGAEFAGNGTGAAVKYTGGATAPAMALTGGATSGEGMKITTANGDAILANASGAGKLDINADVNNLATGGGGGATLAEIEGSTVLAKETSVASAYRVLLASGCLGTEGFDPLTTTIAFDGDTGTSAIKLYDAFPSLDPEEGRDPALGETLMGEISGQTFTPDEAWTASAGGLVWIDTTGPLAAAGTLTITSLGHTYRIFIPAEGITGGLVDWLTGDLTTLAGKRMSVPGINVILSRGRSQSLIGG